MDARDVPTLFRGGVPTSVFADVVAAALGDFGAPTLAAGGGDFGAPTLAAGGGSRLIDFLEALTRTPRFDVAVLFVAGGKQKRAMARAWDEAVAAAAGDAAARLAEARKAYRV